VTWALSRNNTVVHCCVTLATQQFKRKTYPQHCKARDNRHGDVCFYGHGIVVYGLLLICSQSCLEIAECRHVCVCVCVCVRARVRACVRVCVWGGYGLLLVGRLSYWEIAREARVFGSFLIARMRVSIPRPYRLDVYVCLKRCWLCLIVVCWLFWSAIKFHRE
jgi:hypothetical protein